MEFILKIIENKSSNINYLLYLTIIKYGMHLVHLWSSIKFEIQYKIYNEF